MPHHSSTRIAGFDKRRSGAFILILAFAERWLMNTARAQRVAGNSSDASERDASELSTGARHTGSTP